ncbi:hypothetical protein [Streptomyces violascens]|uniref:Erythromycin esterase n=1 Tax=Streptomyces violascens TaxID=67381 RepID=A0ABQ3QTG9_9ACTN|nr:hypothetical protein [Streptomyces violascens]GHI40583.1 hypothetical protein Sviol_49910 [Streptomyces violascens]
MAAVKRAQSEPGTGAAGLQALGVMVGDAKVVGVGEATHGSHEFSALKDRLLRYLVEQKGCTAFALEISGLRVCGSTTTSSTATATHGRSSTK